MDATLTKPASPPEDDADKQRRLAAMNAVADARDPADVTPRQAQDATDWFLSDEEEIEGYKDFELNVGQGAPKWVRFRAGALPRERIDEIRRQNTIPDWINPRTQKPESKTDETRVNLRIAAEGLLIPNLKDPAMRKVRGQDYMDPADALSARFAHKPGLIDQITGEVIDASGYNDDDKREVRAGKS